MKVKKKYEQLTLSAVGAGYWAASFVEAAWKSVAEFHSLVAVPKII